ncbi:hypothetical protein EUZ93_01545 [Wolbachia pipientis]|nr:hypothetical protein [Wolbachia pipientis]
MKREIYFAFRSWYTEFFLLNDRRDWSILMELTVDYIYIYITVYFITWYNAVALNKENTKKNIKGL